MPAEPTPPADDNPLTSFRYGNVVAPDKAFFDSFQRRFAVMERELPPASDSRQAALTSVLGVTHTEFQNRRGVSEDDRARFAEILHRAYTGRGMEDPAAFLESLPAADLEVVRRTHGLVEPIQPRSLSREGAYNLLLPDGYMVDFNHDGLSDVGAAKAGVFPPVDAPAEVRDAWLKATEHMSETEVMVYGMNLSLGLGSAAQPSAQEPAPANTTASYRSLIDTMLQRNEEFRAFLAPGQYERDRAFYGQLQELLRIADRASA